MLDKKKGSVMDSDQLELPKKKIQVSHDDKENSVFMAEASSQPYQGL